jgi:hypothetical protein
LRLGLLGPVGLFLTLGSRLLLSFRPGFLFLLGPSRLLVTLIVLGISWRHGFQQEGQNSQIDDANQFHVAFLPCSDVVDSTPQAGRAIACWIQNPERISCQFTGYLCAIFSAP